MPRKRFTNEQIAFALRRTAEGFLDALAEERLVCTALTVEVTSDRGERRTRTWLHPRVFTPLDVIDRVPGLGARSAVLRQEMVDERLRHRAYTREHGEDPPDVGRWQMIDDDARS